MPSNLDSPTVDRLPENKKSYGQGLIAEWDFTTSNGALLRLREPDIEGLISAGILDDIDPLTGQVKGFTIPAAEGGRPGADPAALMEDPKKLVKLLKLINTVVLESVVAPEIRDSPVDATTGEPDTTAKGNDFYYIHQLGISLKSEIMTEAMKGMNTFGDFREGSNASLGGVSDDGGDAPASV